MSISSVNSGDDNPPDLVSVVIEVSQIQLLNHPQSPVPQLLSGGIAVARGLTYGVAKKWGGGGGVIKTI